MSSRPIPSTLLPNTFRIKIDAYDRTELQLLEKLPQWEKIEPYITAKEIEIQKQTFLKYSLFRQRDIYTLDEIADRVLPREQMLSKLIIESGGFIGINPACDVKSHREEAGDLGEALGLCAADTMFGTTDLDWRRIDEGSKKTLDTTASTKELKIEWESKGSIIHGDDVHPATVSNHKRGIKDKKAAVTAPVNAVRLGSIAILRGNSSLPSNIFIVDPPVEYENRSPAQQRIINRLRNIAGLISTLKPRSPISAALQSRIPAITALNDFSALDSVELRDGLGEPFEVSLGGDEIHSTFFSARSRVDETNVGGHIIFLDENWLFFYGMQGRLIELAASQDFEGISEYETQNLSTDQTVTCVLTAGAFKKKAKKTVDQAGDIVKSDGQYVSFSARGELNYTAGGCVFGWLSRPIGI